MIPVADGGGGPVASFDVDRDAVAAVNGKLVGAAETLDGEASSTPGAPDAGEASALLGDIVAEFAGAAGKLCQEAGMLGDIGTEMLANYGNADEAVATVVGRLSAAVPQ